METDLSSIFPERHPNIAHDASAQSLIRKRDAACIDINESALLIWQLCDGTRSIDEIIHSISSSYKLDSKDASESILPLLQHLHDEHCLTFRQRLPGFKTPDLTPLVKYHPIPPVLHKQLEAYRHKCEACFPMDGIEDDANLNETVLDQLINQPLSRSSDTPAWRDMNLVDIAGLDPLIHSISRKVGELIPVKSARLVNSGHALYGRGGAMGWHTNEDLPGLRIYCNWAEKADSNYFRYLDPDNGEIITQHEPAGWIVKSFYIPPRPKQLWHCLYAGSRRIALGFAEFEFASLDRVIAS